MAECILKYISKYLVVAALKIHCKILSMCIKYYFKFIFKILNINANIAG